ncbi:unnamed protein product [Blepharisma stoltei]|uniref:Uncharacterized protein n=1 Tax=Blepharisma stoltei TaxID=1481888 RepID=A0AAU9IVQ8_9CILI|nr:unnamed protein product [Blepharisma stoltei]
MHFGQPAANFKSLKFMQVAFSVLLYLIKYILWKYLKVTSYGLKKSNSLSIMTLLSTIIYCPKYFNL